MNSESKLKYVLAVIALGSLLAHAQTSGRLTGTVLDPSDAAVPGAKVAIVNQATNAQFTAETNAAGAFSVSQLDAGLYTVRVTFSGFRVAEVKDVKVDVSKEYSMPPLHMELGGVQETVTVTAGINLVQTTNAEAADTLYIEQIKNLPLPSRNPLDLIGLQAGAGFNGLGATTINGTRTSFSNVTIDGINVQDNFIRANGLDYTPALPFLSQVAEMTIVTQNSNASMGNGSSQVAMVTPSGTNAFHGEAFWQNQTNATAANTFFNNASGVAKPFLLLNQGGGSFGGPIRRDKLFFFGYYELYRSKQQASAGGTVLRPDARNGIFTYRDSSRALRTINLLQAANVAIDPRVRDLLQRVPTTVNDANVGDGLNTGGYLFNQRDNRTRDNVGIRLDYNRSEKHNFSGTFAWNRDLVDRPDLDPTFNTVPVMINTNTSKLLSVTWRATFTPMLTNELRGGFHLAPGDFDTSEDFSKPLIDGFIFTNPVDLNRRQGRGTNTYDYMDNASWQRGTHVVRFGWQSQLIRVHYFDDAGITPTYFVGFSTASTRGLLTQQFPGGISASQLAAANGLLASLGGFVSGASQTFNVTSKKSGYVPGANDTRNLTFNSLSFYGTDQWRIRRNLTWNYGLRWEYTGRYDETNGLLLSPVIVNNNLAQTLLSDATIDFAGAKNGRPVYNKDLNNFAPNVGLAWDPWGNGKTAVRLGYSINFVNDEAIGAPDHAVSVNNGLSTSASIIKLTQNISGGPPPVPTPAFQMPRKFSDQLFEDPGAGAYAIDPHLATPYVQQWNVSLQHELPKQTSLEVRYVGNKGTKLYRAFDYNQVDIRSNGFLDDFLRARSNGFLALSRTGTFDPAFSAAIPGSQRLTVFPNLEAGGLLNNSTVSTLIQQGQAGELAAVYFVNDLAGSVPFLPNPNIFVADLLTNRSNSTYHALQVELKRRLRGGLLVNANYTWSKVLTDSGGTNNEVRFDAYLDNGSPRLERSRADFDIPQALKANLVYDLPFGGTHRFTSSNKVFNKLLTGWRTSAIFILQSGPPFSIVSKRGTLNRSARSGYNTAVTALNAGQLKNLLGVKRVGDTIYFIDPKVINGDGRGVGADGDPAFNGQVFFNPDPGQLGTLERRMFNSPAYFDWDLSLMKETTIRENKKLEVRVEFFNLLNNVTFFAGDQNINSADFGKITSTANSPRFLQTVLRFTF